MELFSGPSIWTMIHGIALGGGAMAALLGALLLTWVARGEAAGAPAGTTAASFLAGRLAAASAGLLWLTVLVGTYLIFPPYRVAPPEGATDLTPYPRYAILADPETAWLHSFAMEMKEHVPWIAAMLATSVAFVALRRRESLERDPAVRRAVLAWLALALGMASAMALLGVFVNKVAPVQ